MEEAAATCTGEAARADSFLPAGPAAPLLPLPLPPRCVFLSPVMTDSAGDGGDGVGDGACLRVPACRMADCCVDCLRSLLMRPPPLLLALAREREVGVVLLLVTDTAGRADGAEEEEASLSSLSLSVDSECCGCECDTAGEAERRGAAAAAAALLSSLAA